MEEQLVKYLIENKMTITTAESCTGGMIASTIVNVPGASWVLNEAHVTYANEAKTKILGVKKETLETYGAVSEETAHEMAEGAVKAADADCAIAVTGVAGPDGGTDEKPVGTVYAGYYVNDRIVVERYNFDGDRYEVRRQTADKTISRLYELLTE
ncbi:MAG: CinA family protein [Lachnospiraceae bacterium]|nr:CinA family protein [Lachnospiraceae bacterium]